MSRGSYYHGCYNRTCIICHWVHIVSQFEIRLNSVSETQNKTRAVLVFFCCGWLQLTLTKGCSFAASWTPDHRSVSFPVGVERHSCMDGCSQSLPLNVAPWSTQRVRTVEGWKGSEQRRCQRAGFVFLSLARLFESVENAAVDGVQCFKDTGSDSGERKRASVTAHNDVLQVVYRQRPACPASAACRRPAGSLQLGKRFC